MSAPGRNRPQDVPAPLHDRAHHQAARLSGTLRWRLACPLPGIRSGRPVRAFGRVIVTRAPRSAIEVGDDVTFIFDPGRSGSAAVFAPVKPQTCTASASIRIEDRVNLNGTSIVARSRRIRLGAGAIVASNVPFMDSDLHAEWPPHERVLTPAFEEDADIGIGRDARPGARAIMLRGVTIGDGSIVAAGAGVTRDVPDQTLAGGVPARVIRPLVRTGEPRAETAAEAAGAAGKAL